MPKKKNDHACVEILEGNQKKRQERLFLIGHKADMFYALVSVVDSLLSAKNDGDSLGLLQNRYGSRISQSVSFWFDSESLQAHSVDF